MATNDKFEIVLINALKMPGVKVDRSEFLAKTLVNIKDSKISVEAAIKSTPISAGYKAEDINKIAKKIVNKRTINSAGKSFVAGLPGGVAVAATIPLDTLQYFGNALILAQELAYLFGYEDFWNNEGLDEDRVMCEMALFLGTMFGVSGATATVKCLTASISNKLLKDLPKKALTKTLYYPIIKKTMAMVGIKITKDTFAKGVSKVVPVLGGAVSGTITWTSLSKNGNRLKDALYEAVVDGDEEFINTNYEEVKDFIDADIVADIVDEKATGNSNTYGTPTNSLSVIEELRELGNLKKEGIIDEEEFKILKTNIINNASA